MNEGKIFQLRSRIRKLETRIHKLEQEDRLEKFKNMKIEEKPEDREIICLYHKIKHEHPSEDHEYCISHGHCLNPIQCIKFKYCPLHINGENMFLKI